jgi:hypothetical protein
MADSESEGDEIPPVLGSSEDTKQKHVQIVRVSFQPISGFLNNNYYLNIRVRLY